MNVEPHLKSPFAFAPNAEIDTKEHESFVQIAQGAYPEQIHPSVESIVADNAEHRQDTPPTV